MTTCSSNHHKSKLGILFHKVHVLLHSMHTYTLIVCFCLFSLFDDITKSDEVTHKLSDSEVSMIEVTQKEDQKDDMMVKGVLVDCNGVECIFEFRVFRYTGGQQEVEGGLILPGWKHTGFGSVNPV